MLTVLAAVIAAALVQTVMADIVWVDNKLDDYTGHDGTALDAGLEVVTGDHNFPLYGVKTIK